MQSRLIVVMLALICLVCVARFHAQEPYDLVIANGRVMDPASGLDAVRHVGITGAVIRAISARPLTGRTTIDASDHIVAPGFIDLHQHASRTINPAVDTLKVMDGVTTAMEL